MDRQPLILNYHNIFNLNRSDVTKRKEALVVSGSATPPTHWTIKRSSRKDVHDNRKWMRHLQPKHLWTGTGSQRALVFPSLTDPACDDLTG